MNIVLIIFDSLRKDCLNFLGKPYWGKVLTPNLDKFAQESFVLSNCYPESLPTLPARRAIYTGKRVYPFRNDKKYKGDFVGAPGWGPILENRDTISEILQQNGYATALISDIPHMFKPSKNFHRGFDEWNWIRGYEFDAYRSGPLPGQDEIDYWLPKDLQDPWRVKFLKQCLMNMENKKKEEDFFVARIMKEAARWLKQNTDKDKKFLLIESFSPHEPWFIPDKYRKMYLKKDYPQQVISLYKDIPNLPPEIIESTQANYSGMVTMCDKWFGYLYNVICNLDMLDDTLILVTSDHGHSIGDKDYLGKRGYPSAPEVFDIPLIIRHPDNRLKRGISSEILVQHTDITATILDVLGIKTKKTDKYHKWESNGGNNSQEVKINIHGKSFLKALIEEKDKFRDHVTIGWGSAVTIVNKDWWLNCRVNGKGPFLHNLKSEDPFKINVADQNKEVVKKLYKKALEDAGGSFPDYLIEMADNQEDAPGCSQLVAR